MQLKNNIITALVLLCATVMETAAKPFTLVIDAGHGGHDAGAIGIFSKEKDINLRTALAFGSYVERNCQDVNVIYTRKRDVFVTLHDRADIANKAKADLFISIHTNSLPGGKTARGLETYTLGMHRAADNFDIAKRENSVILVEKDYKERYQGFDPNSAESYIIFELMQDKNMHKSVELAKYVQQNVCSTASRPNKGVKQAGFLVLRETGMPSCLIELGFISTPDEERMLNDETQVDNIAKGIYQAFCAYRAKYDNTARTPFVASEPQEPVIPDVIPERLQTRAVVEKNKPVTPATAPERKTQQKEEQTSKAESKTQVNTAGEDDDKPVFKLQVFVAERVLRESDSRFKGEKGMQYYKEGGMVKYTLGASTNYNEIYRLRKSNIEKFPGCFIIAFKKGEKMNVNEAIREFKANR